MTLANTPDSFLVDAGDNTWRAYLIALNDHVVNNPNSVKWNQVQNADSGAGSDYGVTLTPNDPDEDFHVNYRFEASSDHLFMTVDPNASITDPLSPDLSGAAAPESPFAGRSGVTGGYSTEILVQEWVDTIGFMTKDTSHKYIPSWHIGGRVYEPMFSNDPPRELDGLGWYGCIPRNLHFNWGDDGSSSPSSQFRIPGGWASGKSREMTINSGYTARNTQLPSPYMLDENNNPFRSIGVVKYAFNYHTGIGGSGIKRVISGIGEGWLNVSWDGGVYNLIVPWDSAVSPV